MVLRTIYLEEHETELNENKKQNKIRGSRSLLFYLYSTYVLLILQGVYGYTITNVEQTIFTNEDGELMDTLSLFAILSSGLGIFVYVIHRTIFTKYEFFTFRKKEREWQLTSPENKAFLAHLKKLVLKNILLIS